VTVDLRARSAAADLQDRLIDIPLPEPRAVVRRARRRRHTTTGLAALLVVAAVGLGLVVAQGGDGPDDRTAQPAPGPAGWSRILKADAGISPGASPDEVVSDGERALLVGADYQPEEPPVGAIWWSDDGRTWEPADIPHSDGFVYSAAIDGDIALASGRTGRGTDPGDEPFLWRSEDGGRTWSDTALPAGALGPDAPEMGRPFIADLIRRDGWWIAAGGSSTGYAGLWISEAGEQWEQVLESSESGGFDLVLLEGGRTMAWTGDQAWVTDDPTDWGEPRPMALPDEPGFLMSVADGAAWGVWFPAEASRLEQELIRSADEGRTWTVDDGFSTEHPDASPFAVSRFGDLALVTGFDVGSRPGAWVSTDGQTWQGIPRPLQDPPGGQLSLTAEVDGRIVLFGSAPELDRFYVYEP